MAPHHDDPPNEPHHHHHEAKQDDDGHDAAHTLIVQPDDGVEPVLGAFARAKSSLRIKQFTFTAPSLVSGILDAQKRGVKVQVLLNAKRSTGSRANDETFAALEKAGIGVRWSNPQFAVTHEKSVVIDDTRALIATFNFCDRYFSQTRDYGIITKNSDQIAQIAECFDADWDHKPFSVDSWVSLLWSVGNSRRRMAEFIDGARHRLDIEHPKYVDISILDRITAACERGVHVRIVSSGMHGISDTDIFETTSSLRILRRVGAKVHHIKHPKVHAKVMVADGKRALVGSMNIDRHAFELRRELGIIIEEPKLVKQLEDIFEKDWKASDHYDIPDPLDAIVGHTPEPGSTDFVD